MASISTTSSVALYVLYQIWKHTFIIKETFEHASSDKYCTFIILTAGVWGSSFAWLTAISSHMASKNETKRIVAINLVMRVLSIFFGIAGAMTYGFAYILGFFANQTDKSFTWTAIITLSFLTVITLTANSAIACCLCEQSTAKKKANLVRRRPGVANRVLTISNMIEQYGHVLHGVQVVGDGESRFYPITSGAVAEINSRNGRIVLVNTTDQQVREDPPPSYEMVVKMDKLNIRP